MKRCTGWPTRPTRRTKTGRGPSGIQLRLLIHLSLPGRSRFLYIVTRPRYPPVIAGHRRPRQRGRSRNGEDQLCGQSRRPGSRMRRLCPFPDARYRGAFLRHAVPRSDIVHSCNCPWGRRGFRFYFDCQQGGRGLFPGPPTLAAGSSDDRSLWPAALRSEGGPRGVLPIPHPDSATGGEAPLRSEVCGPTLPKSGWNSFCEPVPSRFSGQALSMAERPSL